MSPLSLTLTLAAKDWRLFWADRRAALLCFAVPIILASAFGMIFSRPAAQTTSTKLPVVVVVEDDGPFTRQVADDLLASAHFDAKEVSRADAEALVAERRAVAVVLPVGFERLKQWQPGTPFAHPTLQLLHHPHAAAERQWAEGVVTEAVMKRAARTALELQE